MGSPAHSRFGGTAGRYALLAGLFVLAAGYQVRALADVVRILRGERVRQPVVLDPLDGRVTRTEPEAEAAGVHPGDRVVAVQGAPFHGRKTIAGALPRARPGDTLDLTIARPEGGERTAPVRLAVVGESGDRRTGRASGMRVVIVATKVALPLLSVGLGFAVAALRP